MFPLPSHKPNHKADSPEEPVYRHGNPYAEHAHVQINPQHHAEAYSEDPHRQNRHPHRIFHIRRSP